MMLATCSTRRNGLIGFAIPTLAPAHDAMNDSAKSGVRIDTTGRVAPETAHSRLAVARTIGASSAYVSRQLTFVGSSLSSTTIAGLPGLRAAVCSMMPRIDHDGSS